MTKTDPCVHNNCQSHHDSAIPLPFTYIRPSFHLTPISFIFLPLFTSRQNMLFLYASSLPIILICCARFRQQELVLVGGSLHLVQHVLARYVCKTAPASLGHRQAYTPSRHTPQSNTVVIFGSSASSQQTINTVVRHPKVVVHVSWLSFYLIL